MSDRPPPSYVGDEIGLLDLDGAGRLVVPAAAAGTDRPAVLVHDDEDAVRGGVRVRVEVNRLGESVPADLLVIEGP